MTQSNSIHLEHYLGALVIRTGEAGGSIDTFSPPLKFLSPFPSDSHNREVLLLLYWRKWKGTRGIETLNSYL